MRTTDIWVSHAAAVSTLWWPLLCSGASVISVRRAGDLKSLGNHRTHIAFASLQEAGVTGMWVSACDSLLDHGIDVQPCVH